MVDYIFSSGVDGGEVLYARDTGEVSAGTLASGTFVYGATLTVSSGGVASATTVSSGLSNTSSGYVSTSDIGSMVILDGGSADGITVYSGAALTISGGIGDISDITMSGGTATLLGRDGYVYGHTLISSGATFIVSGGLLDGYYEYDYNLGKNVYYIPIVYAGGVLSVVSGSANDVYLGSGSAAGGTDYIYSGATVSTALIYSGGVQNVSGGTARTTSVSSGGTENVYAGGRVLGGYVLGGTENIYAGGLVSGKFYYGGVANVFSGGEVSGGTIRAATVNVAAGGSAYGLSLTTFAPTGSGVLDLASGAVASGITVNSGGVVELVSGVNVLSGSLKINSGGLIDIADVAYVNGGSASISGNVLTLTEGGVTESVTLSAPYANLAFTLATDAGGHGHAPDRHNQRHHLLRRHEQRRHAGGGRPGNYPRGRHS